MLERGLKPAPTSIRTTPPNHHFNFWTDVSSRLGRSLLLRAKLTEEFFCGFGSRLVERSARDQLGGEATVDFLPRGVVYTVTGTLDGGS